MMLTARICVPHRKLSALLRLCQSNNWKEAIQQHNAVLMRSSEPLLSLRFLGVHQRSAKGPDELEERSPEVYMDRWYCVDFLNAEYGVVAVEGKVCLHDDGTFSVLEKAAA